MVTLTEYQYNQQEKSTIQLKCKACDGTLKVDADREVLLCPFCGSKELINESDEVIIQRIKSRTYKEVEFEKMRFKDEKEQRKIEQEQRKENERQVNEFRNGKFSRVLIIAFVICMLLMLHSFSKGRILLGMVALIQTGLFASAWLMGMQFVKEKIPRMHILLAAIGFVMIILWTKTANVGVLNGSSNSSAKVESVKAVKGNVNSPSITENTITNGDEGIYTYQIRNYIGKNVASIGEKSRNYQVDEYGNGELKLIFVTEDGMIISSNDEEQMKQYTVVEQSLKADTNITMVHLRDSDGEPYSNLVDYQSYDEIILYVAPIGDSSYKPSYTEISPTLDRHLYHIRDYVGRNAASFGEVDGSGRIDIYGAGEMRLVFTAEDGSYVETSDMNVLKQYIVTGQDIKANTELKLEYETDSSGEEYDNLICSQNYEEINLTVRKIDESVIENMPVID